MRPPDRSGSGREHGLPAGTDRGTGTAASGDRRTAELAVRLADLRADIAAIATSVGRDPAELTLIAVTKTFPTADIRRLAELGVGDVGESRDQEARAKVAELSITPGRAAADFGADGLRWHYVGQLQRNKARSVTRYASAVHSVDRAELVTALERGADAATRCIDVFCQVDLSTECAEPLAAKAVSDGAPELSGAARTTAPERPDTPTRGGAHPADLPGLADLVVASAHLRLVGLMAVAPQSADPDDAFAALARIGARLRQEYPGASALSAGMSGDYPSAIRHGATHLRIGSALLGSRPPPVR